MPIEPPVLDDLTYDGAVQELKRRIPRYAPQWTNWNDSDPGITLIQLFAHLAEQVCWRLNRVPEKNHVELLKLLGVALRPAEPAETLVALLMDKPEAALAGTLPPATRFEASAGGETLTFETTEALDTAPCEVAAIATTRNPFLTDVLKLKLNPADAGARETPAAADLAAAAETPAHNRWFSLRWDGRKPKLKDMPLGPIRLLPDASDAAAAAAAAAVEHAYLWLGLNFNALPTAGFVGVRVTLTVRLDDDEQPSQTATQRCGPMAPADAPAPVVDWLHCLDAAGNPVDVAAAGPVLDETGRLTRSGTLAFTVPAAIAAPAPWANLADQSGDPLAACAEFGNAFSAGLGPVPPAGADCQDTIANYVTWIQSAVAAGSAATATATAAATVPQVNHPLPANLTALPGWLRVTLAAPAGSGTSPKLRIVSFNAVAVVNRTTVTGKLLGTSDGAAGQTFQLRNPNVLPGTLDLVVQEGPTADAPLMTWAAGDLDSAKPSDRTFQADWEAGVLTFGDGRRGMIPPAVPGLGRVVARRYAFGGGAAGNVPVGAIKSFGNGEVGVTGAVNVVAGRGGKDAETLDDAKVRARLTISSRSRAVTARDFEWIASQAPGVTVALARTVPLRVPQLGGAAGGVVAVTGAACGPAVPSDADQPAGLAQFQAHGAVAVVVVPDAPGPEPTPTPSFLRSVCAHLDDHRLVTTEVHVVPPQYCRLCDVAVTVTARPGFTRAMLQAAVADRLEEYLHVLRGGVDGAGYGFGSQVLAADLVAQVFRVEGVETVREFTCRFVRTRTDAVPRAGTLTLCPDPGGGEHAELDLTPDETMSIVPDAVSLSVEA